MDFNSAVKTHSQWKIKLRGAIVRQQKVDAETIKVDHLCEIGKWLHGEGDRRFSTLDSFADCKKKHAEFHRQAGMVANKINAGDYATAEKLMNAGSDYANASSAVGVAIMRLRKESNS